MSLIPYFNFVKGANYSISPFLIGQDQLSRLEGANVSYELGTIKKDLGYSLVDAQIQASKNITGYADFQQSNSVQRELATVNDSTDDDTQLFARTPAAAWVEVGAAETAWANFANINVEIEQFVGYAFFVGWGATDGFLPVGTLTGTTFSTATNTSGMAQGKFIVRYRDRLYVLNAKKGGVEYPYRAYFSDIPTAGSVTWNADTLNLDFVDFDYGLEITGGGSNWDRLIVFTRKGMWLYDQTSKKKVADFGCAAHRTIQNYGSYTTWCTGPDVVTSTGGQPQSIGGEMIDFIRAGIPSTYYAKQVDKEYWLYIGNVTVKGISYTNTVLIYDYGTDSWRVRELYTAMKIFGVYFDATTGDDRLRMGDGDGKVWTLSKYTDSTIAYGDAQAVLGTSGQPITSVFEITIPIGGASFEKKVDNLYAYSSKAGGLLLKGRILDRNSRVLKPYEPIGQLLEFVNSFHAECDRGAILQIEGTESSNLEGFSFYGFEIDINKYSNILKT